MTSTDQLARLAGDEPLFWRMTIDRNGRILRMAFR